MMTQSLNYILQERIKELNCLYQISKLQDKHIGLETILYEIAEIIPSGLSYPEKSLASIKINDTIFGETPTNAPVKHIEDIRVNEKCIGTLSVYIQAEHDQNYEIIEEEKPLLRTIADVVARVYARNETQNILRKFSHAISQSSAIIVITDIDGTIEYVNPKFTEVTGYSIQEALGQNPRILKTKQTCPSKYEELWQTILSGKEWKGEFINRKKNGNSYHEEASISPIKDNSGTIINFLAIKTDITERKKAEQKLVENERRLKAITESANDAIIMVNEKRVITFWNPAAEALFLINRKDVLGKELLSLINSEKNRERIQQIFKENQQKNEFTQQNKTIELKIQRIDERELFIQLSISNIQIEDQWHAVGIIRDITESKMSEKKLLELNEQLSEKKTALEELNRSLEERIKEEVEANRQKDQIMSLQARQAAMGEMIGNIAHQWRQPLNSINLISFDIMDAYQHGELNGEYLNTSYREINKVVQHMSKTIDDFRNFFNPNKTKKEFSMSEIIQNSLSFVSANFQSHNIETIIDCQKDVIIKGYPNELIQVIINILNNAKDALQNAQCDKKEIHIYSTTQAQLFKLHIENTGDPIPEEILIRIFEPYFSTKPQGEGTGLGLYMSKTIIEKNMKGKLYASNTNNGVCFTIEMIL